MPKLPKVPKDFPVKVLKPGEPAKDRATCGTCGRSWDDAIGTEWTPAPSARCPFEYFHAEPEPIGQVLVKNFLQNFARTPATLHKKNDKTVVMPEGCVEIVHDCVCLTKKGSAFLKKHGIDLTGANLPKPMIYLEE